MKEGLLILGIDFDGTIVESKFPEVGELKPNVVKVLQSLDKAGFKIIIHTCRANKSKNRKKYMKDMEKCLKDNKIPYDEIWTGQGKPFVNLFVDDFAFPFTGWDNVLEALLKMINYVQTGKATVPETKNKIITNSNVGVDKKTGKVFRFPNNLN